MCGAPQMVMTAKIAEAAREAPTRPSASNCLSCLKIIAPGVSRHSGWFPPQRHAAMLFALFGHTPSARDHRSEQRGPVLVLIVPKLT